MNSERSYSLDKRTYDDSMNGIFGMSTGFAGTVGETRQATINMNIQGKRGYIKDTANNVLNGWSSKGIEKYFPVQTLTHEFGHILHDCIIHNYNKENPQKLEKVVNSSLKGSLSAGKKKLRD